MGYGRYVHELIIYIHIKLKKKKKKEKGKKNYNNSFTTHSIEQN